MKKLITLFLASIFIIILAASCEDIATPPATDGSGTENPTAKPWDEVASGDIVSITSTGTFTEGSISVAGEIDWFRFQGQSGYNELNWQDSIDPASTSMTADVEVTAYKADGSKISGPIDNGMAEGITATEGTHYSLGEYIYIKVEGKETDTAGTYSLIFS